MKQSPRYPAWLESAIFYNVYPQSYCDSNADGIGDLRGLESRLDYIESLGVSAIWLNPIYPSPFGDAGYDVSDYCAIAPRYGTMADFRCLLKQVHRRGLRLILDLVPGHTSIEHPWFQKSREVQRNEASDRYVWTHRTFQDFDPGFIHGYGPREGSYLPNFFWFQPSLNYGHAHPEKPWQHRPDAPGPCATLAEMERIMQFWLDLGVDGFRVDMAFSLVKGDSDGKANRALWQKVRGWWDRDYPDRVLISEWSWPTRAIRAGFHVDFMIHFNNDGYNSLFRFEQERGFGKTEKRGSFFDSDGRGDITLWLDLYGDFLRRTRGRGFISVPSGNHDLSRLNCGRSQAGLACAFVFLLTLPGVPTIYYGDEIGMRQIPGLPSKEGSYEPRTGARTPMQWDSSANAGFSSAEKSAIYLPIDPNPNRPTVENLLGKRKGLLTLVQALIALRRETPALQASGRFEPLYFEKSTSPFVFLRGSGKERILVAVNPTRKPVRALFPIPGTRTPVIAKPLMQSRADDTCKRRDGQWEVVLGPVSYLVARLER